LRDEQRRCGSGRNRPIHQRHTTALHTPVLVAGGTVFFIAPPLTTGTHSLIAVFTPTNPAVFAPDHHQRAAGKAPNAAHTC
jgi:hypothetical protein